MKQLFVFFSILIISYPTSGRDNTANIGDKLDKNTISGSSELRKDEFPNRPDSVDKNKIPAEAEERMREEEIMPTEIESEFPEHKVIREE